MPAPEPLLLFVAVPDYHDDGAGGMLPQRIVALVGSDVGADVPCELFELHTDDQVTRDLVEQDGRQIPGTANKATTADRIAAARAYLLNTWRYPPLSSPGTQHDVVGQFPTTLQGAAEGLRVALGQVERWFRWGSDDVPTS